MSLENNNLHIRDLLSVESTSQNIASNLLTIPIKTIIDNIYNSTSYAKLKVAVLESEKYMSQRNLLNEEISPILNELNKLISNQNDFKKEQTKIKSFVLQLTNILTPVMLTMKNLLTCTDNSLSDEIVAECVEALLQDRPNYEQLLLSELNFELGNTQENPKLFSFVEPPIRRYTPSAINNRNNIDADWKNSCIKDIEQTIRLGKSVLLVAKAGVGKSVVIRKLAHSLCKATFENFPPMPLVYKCSELDENGHCYEKAAKDKILGDVLSKYSIESRIEISSRLAREKSLIFLFDGLDQIAESDRLKRITKLVRSRDANYCSHCPIVISSRLEKVSSVDFFEAGFVVFEIMPFDDEGVKRFYGSDILYKKCHTLIMDNKELHRIGFFARMIKELDNANQLSGVKTKSDLFVHYLSRFLKRAKTEMLIDQSDLQGFKSCLMDISLAAYQENSPSILNIPHSIISRFPEHGKCLNKLQSTSLLYSKPMLEIEPANLLENFDSCSLGFQHQIIQDYFSAQALLNIWKIGTEEFASELGKMGIFIEQIAEFILEVLKKEKNPLKLIHHQLYKNQSNYDDGRWQMTYLLYLRDKLVAGEKAENDIIVFRDQEELIAKQLQNLQYGVEPWMWLKIPDKSIRYKMIKIPQNIFLMGGLKYANERPVRWINVTQPFMICEVPVTQKLYEEITKKNPSYFIGENRPVESVNWFDAIIFCNALSERFELNPAYDIVENVVELKEMPEGFRLPSEAEWECACRGGRTGQEFGDLAATAWFSKDLKEGTSDVQSKKPNAFGIFDMLGNVFEWVGDGFADNWYYRMPEQNPVNTQATLPTRVLRGGSWSGYFPHPSCSSYRGRFDPSHSEFNRGFRIARSIY